jgi:hypothetical protein
VSDPNSAYDYGAFQEEVTEDKLDALTRLAQLAADQNAEVARISAELEAATAAYKRTVEVDLPSAMEAAGMANFTTSTGLEIVVKERVHAHISRERYPAAVKWLDENGHSGLVKRNVIIAINRGDAGVAADMVAQVRADGLDAKQEFKVEPSTLKKFIREKLEAGEEVPVDLFGVHRYKVAELG